MQRTYFEEVQTFRENRWVPVLVIAISAFTLLPIAYGMYQQLVTGVPWGDKPMSDNGLILMFLSVLVSIGIAASVVLLSRLEVEVNEQGLRYRYFPITFKWQLVTPDNIESYTLEKRFRIFQSGGFGYNRNILRQRRSYRIRGGRHLSLKLKNGQQVLLGTQNPEGLEWAMKKLIAKNETI
jgi:hypothetical protein